LNRRVYFIRPVGADGPVKIGCSDVPDGRLYTLSAWSPVPLEIVASIDGDIDLERRFHAAFKADNTHREWFNASPALLHCLDAIKTGTFDIATLPAPLILRGPRNGSAVKPCYRGQRQPTQFSAGIAGEIEQFCADHNMPLSRFGVNALRDPNFFGNLRRGREPSMRTVERIRAFMSEYSPSTASQGVAA